MDRYEPPISSLKAVDVVELVLPLVYDDTLNTSLMKNVLLIQSNVSEFQTYANENTFAVVYSFSSSKEELLDLLRKKFNSIERVAFVSHYNETPFF